MNTLGARHLENVIARLAALLPGTGEPGTFVGSASQLSGALGRLLDLRVLHDHTGRDDASYRELLSACTAEMAAVASNADVDPALNILLEGLSASSASAAAPRPVLNGETLVADLAALLGKPILQFYLAAPNPADLARRLAAALPPADVRLIKTLPIGGAVSLSSSFRAACLALGSPDVQNWQVPGQMARTKVASGPVPAPVHRLIGLADDLPAQGDTATTIAVLDTGIDRSHPAFRRIAAKDYRNFTPGPDADEDGHGTHVASLVAGDTTFCSNAFRSIAPDCRLIVGKVDSLEQILEAMAWAVFDERVDVISISVNRDDPPDGRSILSRACDEAFHLGTLVCVAAGNVDPSLYLSPGTIAVPADAATAVAVGAIDGEGRLALSSARGQAGSSNCLAGKPNCVAPGIDVLAARSTTRPDGAGLLIAESGTSMAAPVVAGCLALIKSRARAAGVEMPPTDVLRIFYNACAPIIDENGEPYATFEVGRGLVNMAVAFAETDTCINAASHAAYARQPHQRAEQLSYAPARTVVWAENTCYAPRCAHGTYLTKVPGVFSDAWRCDRCGAPICTVCWTLGERRCADHSAVSKKSSPTAPASAPTSTPMRPVTPAATLTNSGAPIPMTTYLTNPCAISDAAELDGQQFCSRFEQRVVRIPEMVNPLTARAVKPSSPAKQETKFRFGDMLRYNFSGGFRLPKVDLRHSHISLIALRLCREGIEQRDGLCVPKPGLIQGLPEAFRFDDSGYYVVGVFSPFGWPALWTSHEHGGANFEVHLVEHAEDGWRVNGPHGDVDFRGLFNPEPEADQAVRVALALKAQPELAVPGSQIALAAFCRHHGFDKGLVERVVADESHGYQLIAHRGQSVIQRSFR